MQNLGGVSAADSGRILAERERLSPLFVISPSTRCGSTFLQRTLNSSREILVYGENPFLIESLPNLFAAILYNFSGERAAIKTATREQVIQDGWDGWYPDLSPEPGSFLLMNLRQVTEQFLYYDEDARRLGYTNWGMKYPLVDAAGMAVIAHVLPKARFLILSRHVADALASARARKFVTDRASAETFVRQWNANMVWLKAWSGPAILRARYEDLVSTPEPVLAEILPFAGVSRIDQAVFSNRVNTFAMEGVGRDPSGYIDPERLTDDDHAIIADLAQPGLRAGGY